MIHYTYKPTISTKACVQYLFLFQACMVSHLHLVAILWHRDAKYRESWIKIQGPNSDKRPNLRGLKWKQKRLKGDETRFVMGSVQKNHQISDTDICCPFSSEVWTPIIIAPSLKRDHKLGLFLRQFKLWQVEPHGELLKWSTFLNTFGSVGGRWA